MKKQGYKRQVLQTNLNIQFFNFQTYPAGKNLTKTKALAKIIFLVVCEVTGKRRKHPMSTTFSSIEGVKECIVVLSGLSPREVIFEEVPNLRVPGFGDSLLDKHGVPEELKTTVRKRRDGQRGFIVKGPKGGELKIVIGPFRDGLDCWVIAKNSQIARL